MKSKSSPKMYEKGNSLDVQARKRVTFLMKTPINELVKSKKYKQFIKESTKEMGSKWWYFTNIAKRNYKMPWLWQFKEGE